MKLNYIALYNATHVPAPTAGRHPARQRARIAGGRGKAGGRRGGRTLPSSRGTAARPMDAAAGSEIKLGRTTRP